MDAQAASGAGDGSDLLERIAEDLAERVRRGGTPSLEVYFARHPELAGELRVVFPRWSW